MAEKYTIPKKTVSEKDRQRFMEWMDDTQPELPPKKYENPEILEKLGVKEKLDYRKPRIWQCEPNKKPPAELEAGYKEAEACQRLWRAVVLQAFIDMCYARTQSKRKGVKWDAIDWLESNDKLAEADRKLVAQFADIHPRRLKKGYQRVKENSFNLSSTMGKLAWRYQTDGRRSDEYLDEAGFVDEVEEETPKYDNRKHNGRHMKTRHNRPFADDPELKKLREKLKNADNETL